MDLRKIDILSDLVKKADNPSLIKNTKEPSTTLTFTENGKTKYFKEVWPKGTERIVDYSQGQPGGLDHFYQQLTALLSKKKIGRPVRIAYFGDSFIEGDILLADLREELQKKYGGNGIGWLDAGNDLNQYKHTTTNKFSGLTEHMVMKADSYDAKQAGIAERYYTLNGNATMSLAPFVSQEYPHTQQWATTWLYLRSPGGANISFNINGKEVNQLVKASPEVQGYKIDGVTSKASIKVSGPNTILFGTAQEGASGIILDNFSMRGSSGMTLAKLPVNTLKQFANVRPYDLIVFQFGVNAVTAKSRAKQVQSYADAMGTVVDVFRQSFPNASILVVGSPDRGSRNSADGSMEGIEMLIGYQEQMAAKKKVGFYNLFKAMGGPGTMMRLVDEQNMGSKDYIHINYKGGKFVSQRIFNSIVAGQKNYANKMKLMKQ